MGITKRRLEAEEGDINKDLRLCFKCGERIDIPDEDTRAWHYEHTFVGPFTTIWLCSECKTIKLKSCLRCNSSKYIQPKTPVCHECLSEYDEEIEHTASEATCDRCGAPVEGVELEIYYDTGLCGWCDHMVAKAMREDEFDSSSKGEKEPEWSPENALVLEERTVIKPSDLSTLALITDVRLIKHLASNPQEINNLTPRQFEELTADLVSGFGYTVKLNKGSKDGGVDVFAERTTDTGKELTIVQCKKHSPDHKVGEPIIKQLYADVLTRNATRGLIVTTSSFTRDALKFIESLRYRLTPADFAKVQDWLQKFSC